MKFRKLKTQINFSIHIKSLQTMFFLVLANTGATIAGVAWFFNYAPYYFLLDSYGFMSFSEKMLSSLASNTAMAYGCQFIIQFEGTGKKTM
jgi:ATP-binding cassette subfamily A (ABC1) protein 3